MKQKILYILIACLLLFGVSYATDINDDMRYGGRLDFTSAIVDGQNALVFEGATENAFTTTFVITEPTANRTVTFGDSSFSAGATNAHTDIVTVTKVTAGTNTVQDAITMDISGADTTTGFGAGIVWKLEDDTGTTTEEHGSIDVVITDGTSTTEESDMVFSVMTNGDVSEVGRFIAAEGATTGDSFKLISNTTETDGVLDTLNLYTAQGAVSVAGMGMGMTWNMPDGTGTDTEQMGSIDVVQTVVTAAVNDADMSFSIMTDGAVNEVFRLVATQSTEASDTINFLPTTQETNGIVDIVNYNMKVNDGGGSGIPGATGLGVGMSWVFPDATGSTGEEQGSLDVVLTDATSTAEYSDFVFSQQVAGAIEERVRFDADDDTILLTGTTPKMTIGDGGDEDAILTFDGQTNDFYMGFDTTDDLFNIGVGSTPGTTPAIEITAAARVDVVVGMLNPAQIHTALDTITVAECGKTHYFNNAAGFRLTLPAATLGCELKFVSQTQPTSGAQDIYTAGGADILQGHIDDIADAAGASTTNGDTINFANSTSVIGDFCDLNSNGTSWFFHCVTGAAAGITVATN